ncbi:MAG: alpha/beta hydrolase, partial [Alphaproteobacteria bacterium]|nr:alpha/beta hydrolase [Alphaproteobacteria bacterium]
AIMASGPRTEQLKKLNCRTLVIHGDADILIKPEAGRHTAECIEGAELKIVAGWGHNMPIAAVPTIAGAMTNFIKRVEAERKS